MLLAAELNEITGGLDRANAMKVRLYDSTMAEVVITHIQPMVIEVAVRDGFFNPSRAQKALRLVRNHVRLQHQGLLPVVDLVFGDVPRAGSQAARAPCHRGDRENPAGDRHGHSTTGQAGVMIPTAGHPVRLSSSSNNCCFFQASRNEAWNEFFTNW
jgi:hypothetical protein